MKELQRDLQRAYERYISDRSLTVPDAVIAAVAPLTAAKCDRYYVAVFAVFEAAVPRLEDEAQHVWLGRMPDRSAHSEWCSAFENAITATV